MDDNSTVLGIMKKKCNEIFFLIHSRTGVEDASGWVESIYVPTKICCNSGFQDIGRMTPVRDYVNIRPKFWDLN